MDIFGKSDVFTSISGPEMMEIVREMGFVPELSKDSGGDPMIRLKIEGLKCQILFYGCTDGRATSLQFSAGFKGSTSLEKMNAWNLKKRYAKAHLDSDGDAAIQWDVDLDGGVRRQYFEECLKRWRSLFAGFVMFLQD